MSKKTGYVGLENLGNTCFINSTLQVIKEIKELNNIIINKKKTDEIKNNNDGIFSLEWSELINIMNTNNGTLRPSRFLEVLQNYAKINNKTLFTGFMQNDIQEFFSLIVEILHKSVSKQKKISINGNPSNDIDKLAIKCYTEKAIEYKKEYSEINEIFQGISVTFIKGNSTQTTSLRPELYNSIILPLITDQQTCINNIYDGFRLYTSPELLQGDNKWFNEEKNVKEDATKHVLFWDLPKVLFILLKRFAPNGKSKIQNVIDFPIDNLDLSNFVCGYKANSYKYELFGVCNHSGGLLGGHYTAYVKNKYNEWIHYNDTTVNIVSNPNDIITAKAYCLFYRKKNN
jgi:ubiquitin carboxyl-terminal hydrolase 8